jgi:hypothetical protein
MKITKIISGGAKNNFLDGPIFDASIKKKHINDLHD